VNSRGTPAAPMIAVDDASGIAIALGPWQAALRTLQWRVRRFARAGVVPGILDRPFSLFRSD
jgi:hypothetical protein